MSDNISQGYMTMATGKADYIDMACGLALSIAINDPTRTIALLTDEASVIPDSAASLFSHVIRMSKHEGLDKCLNKLLLAEYTPFEETLFIDADCFLAKNDVDRHWKLFAEHELTVAGSKATSGTWHQFDVAEKIKELDIPYMARFNAGAIYFKRSSVAKQAFQKSIELTRTHAEILAVSHRLGGYSQEPFLGVAMGMMNLVPVSYSPAEGSLMVTTVSARRFRLDVLNGECKFEKHGGYRFFGRFFRHRWVEHSPTIAHFINLKPTRVYQREIKRLNLWRVEQGL